MSQDRSLYPENAGQGANVLEQWAGLEMQYLTSLPTYEEVGGMIGDQVVEYFTKYDKKLKEYLEARLKVLGTEYPRVYNDVRRSVDLGYQLRRLDPQNPAVVGDFDQAYSDLLELEISYRGENGSNWALETLFVVGRNDLLRFEAVSWGGTIG